MAETRNIDIAEVLRDAQIGDLRTLADERMAYDQLHAATDALFDLLDARGVDHVLVGGLAVLQYVAGRNTRDIDLILAPSDVDRLPELEVASRDQDFARASFRGVQIDLLLTSNRVFDGVRAKYATVQQFAGRDMRCATPEGLVILKLFALPSLYRKGDFGRVFMFEGDVDRVVYECGVDPIAVTWAAERELGPDFSRAVEHAEESLRRIRRFEVRGIPGGRQSRCGPCRVVGRQRMSSVKQEVRRIAEELSEEATWDEVMERVYVLQAIEAGLKAGREGRVKTVEEIRKSYGLPE